MRGGAYYLRGRYLGENSRDAVNELTEDECIAIVRDYLMQARTKEAIVFDLMFARRPFNLRATAKEALDCMDFFRKEGIRYGGVTIRESCESEKTASKSVKRTNTTKSKSAPRRR